MALLLAVLLLACPAAPPTERPRPDEATGAPVEGAPAAGSPAGADAATFPDRPLRRLPAVPAPAGRLVLDAGHGAPKNSGNRNWACEPEADVMRRLADALTPTLVAAGLEVRRTRPDPTEVDYGARVALANDARWLVSLHSDSRAGTRLWADPATGCFRSEGARGFAVLWSDEGEATLVAARQRLARRLATRLAEAGFHPYAGTDYPGLYDGDEVPGVFVDRHEPGRRIRLLRRPTVPSVLVETHQAWDEAEARAWEEPATREAFASALVAALADLEAPTP